jgi:hypothetical protein
VFGVSLSNSPIANSDAMIFKIRCVILRARMPLNICVTALFLFGNALEDVKIRLEMELFYIVE